jgi:hypothetical protein
MQSSASSRDDLMGNWRQFVPFQLKKHFRQTSTPINHSLKRLSLIAQDYSVGRELREGVTSIQSYPGYEEFPIIDAPCKCIMMVHAVAH